VERLIIWNSPPVLPRILRIEGNIPNFPGCFPGPPHRGDRANSYTPEVRLILAEMVCISKLFKSRETKGWQIHAILKVIGRKRQSLDDPAFVIYITPKDS
jgi:hypothetical protein